MQLSRFPTGGFVLHRIVLNGISGRFSAWYDATGKLLDAEQFVGTRNRALSGRHTRIIDSLNIIGKRNVA